MFSSEIVDISTMKKACIFNKNYAMYLNFFIRSQFFSLSIFPSAVTKSAFKKNSKHTIIIVHIEFINNLKQ